MAIYIAYIDYAFTVLSNPLNIVFNGAAPEAKRPSYEESKRPRPYFFRDIQFFTLSGRSTPSYAGISVWSIQSPIVPLLAIKLSR